MTTLQLKIVTPEGSIFDGPVTSVTLPGSEGEFMVMPQHAPLLSSLVAGELRYVVDQEAHYLAIAEGFVEVTNQTVHVLTDVAVTDGEIDEQAVEKAIASAQLALKEKELQGDEQEEIEAGLVRSLAQLKLKRKHRS
jgi:F-type H+-transporting ATPase subunit epsilon